MARETGKWSFLFLATMGLAEMSGSAAGEEGENWQGERKDSQRSLYLLSHCVQNANMGINTGSQPEQDCQRRLPNHLLSDILKAQWMRVHFLKPQFQLDLYFPFFVRVTEFGGWGLMSYSRSLHLASSKDMENIPGSMNLKQIEFFSSHSRLCSCILLSAFPSCLFRIKELYDPNMYTGALSEAVLPCTCRALAGFAQAVLQRVSGQGSGEEGWYRELLCNVVNKQQTVVSFSISQRGILFPLEMGADVKAISVSGFTVMSLEPAKSWGQMSVLYWFLVPRTFVGSFHPCPSPPPAKRTQNITVWRT